MYIYIYIAYKSKAYKYFVVFNLEFQIITSILTIASIATSNKLKENGFEGNNN